MTLEARVALLERRVRYAINVAGIALGAALVGWWQ